MKTKRMLELERQANASYSEKKVACFRSAAVLLVLAIVFWSVIGALIWRALTILGG